MIDHVLTFFDRLDSILVCLIHISTVAISFELVLVASESRLGFVFQVRLLVSVVVLLLQVLVEKSYFDPQYLVQLENHLNFYSY